MAYRWGLSGHLVAGTPEGRLVAGLGSLGGHTFVFNPRTLVVAPWVSELHPRLGGPSPGVTAEQVVEEIARAGWDQVARLFMHELVMNYAYIYPMVGRATLGIDAEHTGRASTHRPLDYSRFDQVTLDEGGLDENVGALHPASGCRRSTIRPASRIAQRSPRSA